MSSAMTTMLNVLEGEAVTENGLRSLDTIAKTPKVAATSQGLVVTPTALHELKPATSGLE